MTIHDDVNNYWENNAEHWFHLSETGIDIWRDYVNTPAFMEMLPDVSTKIGLDIGCGDGHNSRLLAKRCKSEIYRVLSPNGFFQFSITHPCFNEFNGEWIKEGSKFKALKVKNYFVRTEGKVHEWQHLKALPGTPNFRVPRFLRPLSEWINLLLETGFMLEEMQEPYASEKAIEKYPELESTRIVGHSLIIRLRKNEQNKEHLRKIIEKL